MLHSVIARSSIGRATPWTGRAARQAPGPAARPRPPTGAPADDNGRARCRRVAAPGAVPGLHAGAGRRAGAGSSCRACRGAGRRAGKRRRRPAGQPGRGGRAGRGRKPCGRVSRGRIPCGRIPRGRIPRGRVPRGRAQRAGRGVLCGPGPRRPGRGRHAALRAVARGGARRVRPARGRPL